MRAREHKRVLADGVKFTLTWQPYRTRITSGVALMENADAPLLHALGANEWNALGVLVLGGGLDLLLDFCFWGSGLALGLLFFWWVG